MAVSISENLMEVRKRLKRAARKAGRDLSEITLIAVTKNVEPRLIRKAIKEGLRVFGESYIQEAQEKIKKIGDKQKKWHFIGHLQKNKARFAVDLFDCIHSIDTPGLARELNRRASRTIDVLIQVNISGEKTKHGATPEEAMDIARLMPSLKNLRFRGLMAIPPAVDPPERARPYFITLRRLAERINRERIPGVMVHDLSMGMSADFDIAIEEGATMVRVGTAIFGPREAVKKKPAPPGKRSAAAQKARAATSKKVASPKKNAGVEVKKAVTSKKAASQAKKAAKGVKKGQPLKKTAPSAKKTGVVKKAGTTPKKKAAQKKKPPSKKTVAKAAPAKKTKARQPAKSTTTAKGKKTPTARKTATSGDRGGGEATGKKKAAVKKSGQPAKGVKKAQSGKKAVPSGKKAGTMKKAGGSTKKKTTAAAGSTSTTQKAGQKKKAATPKKASPKKTVTKSAATAKRTVKKPSKKTTGRG